MAPAKRKRSERSSVDSADNRPSPHRPGNSNLAQQDRGQDGGNRRSSRGNQGGGRGGRRNDRDNTNRPPVSARATPTPGPMSPLVQAPASATPNPTPIIEPSNPIPKPDPAPFYYEFLNNERIAAWEASGRQEVTQLGSQARQDEDATDLSSALQEFTRAVLDGRIDPTEAGTCVQEILGPDTAGTNPEFGSFDPHRYFLDTLSMMCDDGDDQKNPALKHFIFATGVSPNLMRQNLDASLLQALGITRDTFIRVGIRQATHLLYRQANYNLLREETEGYSKLVTELFTTSGREPPSSEVVEEAFEKVKGLIGTFDLDVGRVLDITLDVFAAVLIKHFRFFIKLLRVSSWWPRTGELEGAAAARCGGLPAWALPTSPGWLSTEEDEELSRQQRSKRDTLFWPRAREVGLDAFFELGGRQMVDEESRKHIFSDIKEVDSALDADRAWIEGTGTYPPSGNRVAAQLLGFKLRFYTSAARDKEDVLPSNLIYLTALLIKIGFISLRDLYPHLWPLDEDMPAVRETKRKELQEKERQSRPGGATNALLMAGALSDDTLPSSGRSRDTATAKAETAAKPTAEVEEDEKLDEPIDQKVQLLTCLLTIGAIPESLFILGRFPWLPEAYPELLDLINRILSHSIKDVYDTTKPTSDVGVDMPTKKVADMEQSGLPKGQVRLTQISVRKQLRWPFPDKHDTAEGNSYRFYWDEWADNIPVCQNVDDVFTLCGTLLNYSGVGIGKDPALLSKLARIGARSLTEDRSQENLDRWQDLLKRLLVPALSLTKSNTSVVNEIYDLLRFYPVSIRYSIYAEWFEGQISRLPMMKSAFARTTTETQSVMKRISKTNLTLMARNLAKIAFASPGIVFRVALGQIEAYTNLTEVVVECAKYFTDLGYDVLVWSLASSLGGKDRNRNNSEFALLPSRWLLALARFSGAVFKRYSIMNITPVLRYVNDQLYKGNSTDLVILKELMAEMAGVVPDTDFNDAQIAAMTGRDLLRRQTLINLQDRRYQSVKTSRRLMKALTDTRLAGELLVAIAQHRQAAIYSIPDSDAHIKLLATMIDDTQLILFQYLDLLRSSLSVEEFDKQVPGISDLLTDFGLQPALAFMISRTSILSQMAHLKTPVLNGLPKDAQAISNSTAKVGDADGDVVMSTGDIVETPNGTNGTETLADVPMTDVKEGSPAILDALTQQSTEVYNQILAPISATVQKLSPETGFKALTPEFYVTFWILGLGDIVLARDSYENEIKRLMSDKTAPPETRPALMAEYEKYMADFLLAERRLLRRKSYWFNQPTKADTLSDEFIEKCLLPRLLLSPADADYCFRMIKLLHDNCTPHFRTLSLYVQLFKTHRLRSIIFTCTVREAENLGRFLRLVLADLARWHSSSSIYEKEAWGKNKSLIGFAKAVDGEGKPKGFLDYDGQHGFRNILLNWHKNINSALRECLDGTEWMHIRNAITVLKTVAEVFPAVDFMGKNFIKQLETVTKREKDVREDLSLTGNAVLVQLKKRSKNWTIVQAFGFSIAAPSQANGGSKDTPSRQASTPRTTLKATAPEFKPQSRQASAGTSTPKHQTAAEVEDGEVDDAKAQGAASSTSKPTSSGTASEPKPALSNDQASEPKKSDILIRREKIQRENAAKAAAAASSLPSRTDTSRHSTPTSRGGHNLPSRPDAPFPSRQELDRHPRHGDRDGRDPRLVDPRLGRHGDRPGDRPRDYPPGDRRPLDPSPRDFGRASDRGPPNERERARLDPPRWVPPESTRDNVDRGISHNRGTDMSGRLSRDNAMPPPRSGGPPERGPSTASDRAPPVNPERKDLINPERAALISNASDSPRSDSPRRGRDEGKDRVSSRPQSPRRHASDKDHSDSRRDDRSVRSGQNEQQSSQSSNGRGRADEPQAPPAGPRNNRPLDQRPNDRQAFQPTLAPSRPMDPNHGRLNSTPNHQPDPNFGRLNQTPSGPFVPSGPGDRRGNRMQNSGPSREEGRLEAPRPPTPDKQPPTGPASNRNSRRNASGQFNATSAPSAPSTPAAASPSIGVHPDRAKHLGSQAQSQMPQTPSHSQNNTPSIGMHPDRARAYANEPSQTTNQMSNQNMNNRSRQQVTPLTTGPPSGPKANQGSPIGPGTNGIAAPTGPASAAERAQRGVGGRRQLSNINTMLQNSQSSAPPTDRFNVRGRGRVPNVGMPDTPISGPSTPAPPPPPFAPTPEPVRDAPRDLTNPERVDLITGAAPSGEDREKDRGNRRERSGRHSRRGSRSPGRERESRRGGAEESSRDHRERRGEPDRERHPGRDSPHTDLMAGREPRTGPRDSGSGRDRSERERSDRDLGRSSRDGGRDRESRDSHDANWAGGSGRSERGEHRGNERGGANGGRSRDMRNDQRGEERRNDDRQNRDDGGRKRHSEEGGNLDPRGREKRPRRG